MYYQFLFSPPHLRTWVSSGLLNTSVNNGPAIITDWKSYHPTTKVPNGLFLPRDASAERGYEIACRPSVCPSVRNV